MTIDTSPAALRKLEEALSGTDIGTRELLYLLGKGVAAEKESNKCQRKNGECWAKFFDGEKEAQQTEPTLSGPAILSRNMVAPADVPLPEPCTTALFAGPDGAEFRSISTEYDPHCARHSVNQLRQYAEAYAKAAVAAERERWIDAVTTELDNNGQAKAIVLAAVLDQQKEAI